MMRVLIMLDNADTRIGAVNDALDLAELARPLGVDCILSGPLTQGFIDLAAARGIRAISKGSRPISRREIAPYTIEVASWVACLVRVRPSVVHLNYASYAPSVGLAARMLRIPLVSRPGPYVSYNRSNRWIDAYVANCREQAREILASPLAERVTVAGDLFRPTRLAESAVLLRPLPPRRAGRVRIVFLGQLVERKGLHVLVEAFAEVADRAELLLVGGDWSSSGYPAQVRRRIAELRLTSAVHLENHREDIAAILETADVFVLPSLSEARPRSVIEAMFAGLPVVSTRVGGLPELVLDGTTGILVEPGDARCLAGALRRVVNSRETREVLGRAGRAYAKREFDPARTASRYVALYRRVGSWHVR